MYLAPGTPFTIHIPTMKKLSLILFFCLATVPFLQAERLVLVSASYGKNILAITDADGKVLWSHKTAGPQRGHTGQFLSKVFDRSCRGGGICCKVVAGSLIPPPVWPIVALSSTSVLAANADARAPSSASIVSVETA